MKDGEILNKIENDVQVMLLLQSVTNSSERNGQLIPNYRHRDVEFESLQDNSENMIIKHRHCVSNMECSEVNNDSPRSGVHLKITYSPPKCESAGHKIQGTGHCHRHSKNVTAKKIHTHACLFTKDYMTKGNNQGMTQKDPKMLQELKYSKIKLEQTEEALKSEVKAKLKANDAAENFKDKYERLCKDFDKLKKNATDLDKLKAENCVLHCQLASKQREQTDLLALVETKEGNIKQIEKTLCMLKCENKLMHEEGENKIQELLSENLELGNKFKELDKILAHTLDEAHQKEKLYQKELSRRPTLEEVETNDTLLEEKCKQYECSMSEKEAFLKEAKEKNEELEVKLNMAKEASNRSLLAEVELKNSNLSLEEKLIKTEKEKKELEDKLAALEKEKEDTISELNEEMKIQSKRIEELSEANKTLEESLLAKSASIEKKENQVAALRERSLDLSDQLEALQNSISKNESKMHKEASQQTIESFAEGDDALSKLDATEKELEKTRATLQTEKEEITRRGRIIYEYEETIKKMKGIDNQKLKELEQIIREKERSEMNMRTSFCQERRQNERLLDEITKLRWQEKELTEQLNETLAQLAMYERESAETEDECIEHSRKLQQIEDEVEMKTAEWYNYTNKLTQERDAAIDAARVAKQKLMASVAEFQRHITIQRRVQQMLTRLLHQRECELRVALRKASKHTYHPYIALRRRLSQKRMRNAYSNYRNLPSLIK